MLAGSLYILRVLVSLIIAVGIRIIIHYKYEKKIGTYKGKPIIAIGNNIESKPNIDSKRELHDLYGRPKFIELVLPKLCKLIIDPTNTNIISKEVTYEYINQLQNIAIDLNWFTTEYREAGKYGIDVWRIGDTINRNFNNINMLSLLNDSPYQDAILVKYNEVLFGDDGGSESTPFTYQNPNKKYLDIIVPLGPVYNESFDGGPFSLRLIYIQYEMNIQNKTVVCTECKYINYK